MWIETLRLKDFRNYDELTIHPSSGVNILYGQNGSGKTNIIESIHYCALGKSHRTNQDKEVVRKDKQGAACGVIVIKNQIRDDIAVKLTPNEARKKSVFIGHKRAERISSLMGHLQCVIFSPEDLLMIKEGPGIRRKYIDIPGSSCIFYGTPEVSEESGSEECNSKRQQEERFCSAGTDGYL